MWGQAEAYDARAMTCVLTWYLIKSILMLTDGLKALYQPFGVNEEANFKNMIKMKTNMHFLS